MSVLSLDSRIKGNRFSGSVIEQNGERFDIFYSSVWAKWHIKSACDAQAGEPENLSRYEHYTFQSMRHINSQGEIEIVPDDKHTHQSDSIPTGFQGCLVSRRVDKSGNKYAAHQEHHQGSEDMDLRYMGEDRPPDVK